MLRDVSPAAAEGYLNALLNGDMAKLVDDLDLSDQQIDTLSRELTESGVPQDYIPVSYEDGPKLRKVKKEKPEPPREKGLPLH